MTNRVRNPMGDDLDHLHNPGRGMDDVKYVEPPEVRQLGAEFEHALMELSSKDFGERFDRLTERMGEMPDEEVKLWWSYVRMQLSKLCLERTPDVLDDAKSQVLNGMEEALDRERKRRTGQPTGGEAGDEKGQ